MRGWGDKMGKDDLMPCIAVACMQGRGARRALRLAMQALQARCEMLQGIHRRCCPNPLPANPRTPPLHPEPPNPLDPNCTATLVPSVRQIPSVRLHNGQWLVHAGLHPQASNPEVQAYKSRDKPKEPEVRLRQG